MAENTNPHLTARWVLFEILLRNALFGFGVGALIGVSYVALWEIVEIIKSPSSRSDFLGTITGFFLLLFFAGPIGMILGGAVGLLAGITSGVITGVLTIVAFFPLTREKLYHIVTRTITTLTGIAVTLWATPAVLKWLLPPPRATISENLGAWIVPALIAGVGAFWASGRISRWYVRETQKRSTGNMIATQESREEQNADASLKERAS